MSGSRHARMNAIRIRKENQVPSTIFTASNTASNASAYQMLWSGFSYSTPPTAPSPQSIHEPNLLCYPHCDFLAILIF